MPTDDLEISAYRGLWCKGCGHELDLDGHCPKCEPAATDAEIRMLLEQSAEQEGC